MKFKVFHVANKPINVKDRSRFIQEMNAAIDELGDLSKIPQDETETWHEINRKLDATERRLRRKYPSSATWTVHNLEQLWDLVEKFGTISICREETGKGKHAKVIYLTDILTTETLVSELKEDLSGAIRAEVKLPADVTDKNEANLTVVEG